MNKEDLFGIWADDRSIWSQWTKPVLFAHLDILLKSVDPIPLLPAVDASSLPRAEKNRAVVLDLPGAESVAAGLALAALGHRPVPLYNAIPLPHGAPAYRQAVDMLPILAALYNGAPAITAANIPEDAPPAFLLDAGRMAGNRKMQPNEFDNRSICFTTDFPSANFLASRGITKVLLVQKSELEPQSDLSHILLRWQQAGVALERMRLDPPAQPAPFQVPRPRWYAAMFQRVLAAVGLRRAPGGGYGAWVPDSSSGG